MAKLVVATVCALNRGDLNTTSLVPGSIPIAALLVFRLEG